MREVRAMQAEGEREREIKRGWRREERREERNVAIFDHHLL